MPPFVIRSRVPGTAFKVELAKRTIIRILRDCHRGAARDASWKLLGEPVDRVDGPLKVTGAAPYPSDVTFPGLVHAALVQSTIAAGDHQPHRRRASQRPRRASWR